MIVLSLYQPRHAHNDPFIGRGQGQYRGPLDCVGDILWHEGGLPALWRVRGLTVSSSKGNGRAGPTD